MKPWLHARLSARRFGGEPSDYIKVHDFIDSSKAHFPDVRHRALLHSSFGIYLCEQMFGHNITTASGRQVSTRDIAEQHVIEDLGRIPTVQDYLQHLSLEKWFGGPTRRNGIAAQPLED